jgi:hypothetical protein
VLIISIEVHFPHVFTLKIPITAFDPASRSIPEDVETHILSLGGPVIKTLECFDAKWVKTLSKECGYEPLSTIASAFMKNKAPLTGGLQGDESCSTNR